MQDETCYPTRVIRRPFMKTLIPVFALALSCSGCTVVAVTGSVVSTGVSVVGTAVSTGVSVAGSAVRGVARAVTPSDAN